MNKSGQMNNSKKRIVYNNRGTTMLETMVAFVVLMTITGVLFGIIAFCSELRMSAADTNRAMETFSREIYRKNPDSSVLEVRECKSTNKMNSSTKEYKSLFYLQISEETDGANLGLNAPEMQPISLEDLQARTYKYNIDGYKGVVPKAIEFVHKKDWPEDNTGY